ncbi:D-glycero-beta-D-manno-heptose 1,7-bisphosphate 7-phosphatase [Sulfurimonas sp. HSL1-6]|uniref:D-glycero-beta-D-manno-heptose 1,7-bisphosphate 7-phosphatase n=1 Tax=Thiomicrolovo immobilis TaxID=3131935 RepID=UPI0031F7D311
MRKALFLDRDGVINKEKNYLYKIEDFEFIDGVFETCRTFQEKGYLIIVITNQAGIARGKYTEDDYQQLTRWMIERFADEGVTINAVYHCPHHPDFSGECSCRKPEPGMLEEAKAAFDIDMASSVLVGDKESDIEAGLQAGISVNILVKSGHQVDAEATKAKHVLQSIKELILID